MADRVQRVIESMAPALDDLREKAIFTPDELRQIVKRRTEFEYLIHRRAVEQIDFLRYIEYELGLEADRKRRRDELGVKKKSSASEWAGMRHIHFIYERALTRFKHIVPFWKRYIRFCQRTDAKKPLARTFARALSLHPNEVSIWIQAADHEFVYNQNMSAARVLLQRGLRLNGQSQVLWREYYKLEWLYARKLRERQRVLVSSEDYIEVDGDKAVPKGLAVIVSGTVPRTVYRNACRSIPDDVEFRLSFVPLAHELGADVAMEHEKEIINDCVVAFPHTAASWFALVEHGDISGFERGLSVLDGDECVKLWDLYVNYLVQNIEGDKSDESECIAACQKAHDMGIATVNIYHMWLRVVLAKPYRDIATVWTEGEAVLEHGLGRHADSALLWHALVALTAAASMAHVSVDRSIEKVLEAATHSCSDALLWSLHAMMSGDDRTVFRRALRTMKDREAIMLHYFDWVVASTAGHINAIKTVRGVCDELMQWRPIHKSVLGRCIGYEHSLIDLGIGDAAVLRRWYEMGVSEYGKDDEGMWREYMAFETMVGSSRAAAVYRRAVSTLDDASEFIATTHL